MRTPEQKLSELESGAILSRTMKKECSATDTLSLFSERKYLLVADSAPTWSRSSRSLPSSSCLVADSLCLPLVDLPFGAGCGGGKPTIVPHGKAPGYCLALE